MAHLPSAVQADVEGRAWAIPEWVGNLYCQMVSLQDLGVLVCCLNKDEDALVLQPMLVL